MTHRAKQQHDRTSAAAGLTLALPQPLHLDWVLSFLGKRALPGVEKVEGRVYQRCLDGHWIRVTAEAKTLRLHIPRLLATRHQEIIKDVSRLFDLAAPSTDIDQHLRTDARLADLVRQASGLRVPGVWDNFEGVLKAILGQQVSLARSIILASKLMQRFGEGAVPSPAALVSADVSAIGIPGVRGEAIRQCARLVMEQGPDKLSDAPWLRQLKIPGIGPWTKEYCAMRLAKDPDAFPASDWVIRKVLGVNAKQAIQIAEPWRPYRAYAVMHLWRASALQQRVAV